jgi:hypothetical protein
MGRPANACDHGVAAHDADFKKRMARNSHASHCSTAGVAMVELLAANDDLIQPFWMNVFYGIAFLVAVPIAYVFWRGLRSIDGGE